MSLTWRQIQDYINNNCTDNLDDVAFVWDLNNGGDCIIDYGTDREHNTTHLTIERK